jgi:CBS domain-containing protein
VDAEWHAVPAPERTPSILGFLGLFEVSALARWLHLHASMTTDNPPTDDRIQLRIRARRTLDASGELSVASRVFCRRQARHVALGTCMDCTQCDAIVSSHVFCLDPEGARADVVHLPARLPRISDGPLPPVADRMPISAIMTSDVVCVRSDVAIEDLASLLTERKISGVPVVDAAGEPVGVVSKSDLVRNGHRRGTVADIMTGVTLGLPEWSTIAQAAALMAYEGVHRLPVTGSDGTVVGIVSAMDILRWTAQQAGYVVGERGPRFELD